MNNKKMSFVKASTESNIYWKKQFHKIPLFFRIYEDFEANNEIDNFSIENKTTNVYKQNQVCNCCNLVSDIIDVSKTGWYESPLVYDNVEWSVYEIIKLEKSEFLSKHWWLSKSS